MASALDSVPRIWLAALGLFAASCRAPATSSASRHDWLIDPRPYGATFRQENDRVVLSNGLVARTFVLAPELACVALDQLTSGQSLLRAVEPEATLTIDGTTYSVGGLAGQPDRAFLREEWLASMTRDPHAFHFRRLEQTPVDAPIQWRRVRPSENRPWPPPGVHVVFEFAPPSGDARVAGLVVRVHHQLLDGLPLVSKWIEVENRGTAAVTLERYESERLAAVEPGSSVEATARWPEPTIRAFSDYSMGGRDRGVEWRTDPSFTTQVSYRLETPCLLVARPELGPAEVLEPGEVFRSHTVHELLEDSAERERNGLALRRAMRALAPWCTENPLIFHARSAAPEDVRRSIDQAADVGFELVILSFGSGFDFESTDPAYAIQIRALADYAHSRGVELGGYTLLASRRISDAHDVIDPVTGRTGHAIFGNSPCLESSWGHAYFEKIERFREAAGLDAIEHDGNYPGDLCASKAHPGHAGLADSQWKQWRRITDFYARCRAAGTYLNVPDLYFLNGASKTAMGYRETNWSLPRAEQPIHARQNIFDGTWEKTPSMGWMFVPLSEYQGGGAAATIEPLAEHLDTYEAFLQLDLGAGVQACWRGPRLYDTDATRALVRRWVDWFQARRAILESDVIHLRRADGRDWDGLLHVNPELETKALAVLFNPLDEAIEREIRLPLEYTGLEQEARVRIGEGAETRRELDRGYGLALALTLPPGMTWVEVR